MRAASLRGRSLASKRNSCCAIRIPRRHESRSHHSVEYEKELAQLTKVTLALSLALSTGCMIDIENGPFNQPDPTGVDAATGPTPDGNNTADAAPVFDAAPRTDYLENSALVDNPDNIYVDDAYALAQYATSLTCPAGDFSPNGNNGCVEAGSAQIVRGWILVVIEPPVSDPAQIDLLVENANDLCYGDGCGGTTGTNIFATDDWTFGGTDWTFVGTHVHDNNPGTVVTQSVPVTGLTSISAVLIGRNGAGNHRPDPRWYGYAICNDAGCE